MMTPADRRRVMLHYEGTALANVGMHDAAAVADHTRVTMDGLANALIRLEGVEAAASYLFALGDRVAGSLKEPTDFRAPVAAGAPPVADPEPQPEAAPAEPVKTEAKPQRWPSYLLGVLHGLLLAFIYFHARG